MPRDVFGEGMAVGRRKKAATKQQPFGSAQPSVRDYLSGNAASTQQNAQFAAGVDAKNAKQASVLAAVGLTPGVDRPRPMAPAGPIQGLARPGSIGSQPILEGARAPMKDPSGGMVPFRPGKPVAPAQPETDASLLSSFTRAGAPLEGSHYLASTAGIREPGTLVTPRRTPPGAPNLTAQKTPPAQIAPGPYAPGRVAMGGGLRLGQQEQQPSVAGAIAGSAAPEPRYRNPKSPVYSPEQLAGAAQSGYDASLEVERLSKYGTTAIPAMEQRIDFNGNPVPGLRGNDQARAGRTLVGGAYVTDPEKRQAYLDRTAGPNKRAADDPVFLNAQARSQARKQRIADRNLGPSVADVVLARVAQDDPAAAAALLGQHNTRRAQLSLDQQRIQQEGELGRGQLGVERDKATADLARYGREDATKFGELAQQAEANAMAARQAGDYTAMRRYMAEAENYRNQALGQSGGAAAPAPAPAAAAPGAAPAPGAPAPGAARQPGWAGLDEYQQEQVRNTFNSGPDGAYRARDLLRQMGIPDDQIGEIINEVSNPTNWFYRDSRTAEDPSWWGSFFRGLGGFSGSAPAAPAPEPESAEPSVAGVVKPTKAKGKARTAPRTPPSRIPELLGIP